MKFVPPLASPLVPRRARSFALPLALPLALTLALVSALVLASPVSAQRWSWPENPENLQVLEGMSGQELSPVMRGFAQALGVRCNHCHVGEDGAPLSEIDFVSDDNPNKDRAREMLRMVGSIRGHLERITPSAGEPVEVGCVTCHRGVARPMRLGEELERSYRADGLAGATAHYADLKERLYGHGAYDFASGAALNALGHLALGDGDAEGAIEVFKLATTEHPESSNAWDSLGEALAAAGRTQEAIESYEKALELQPRNRNAQAKLQELRGEGR